MAFIENRANHVAEIFTEISKILWIKDEKNESAIYKKASQLISNLNMDVCGILKRDGLKALEKINGIGPVLAKEVEQFCQKGYIRYFENLMEDVDPELLLQLVPSVSCEMASTLVGRLAIESYSDLIWAIYTEKIRTIDLNNNTTLQIVSYFRKYSMWLNALESKYFNEQSVKTSTLLEMDHKFREQAKLKKIEHLTITQKRKTFSIGFSNSQKAILLGKQNDWVRIAMRDNGHLAGWTIITGKYGKLRGKRIVMGRIDECQKYYEGHNKTRAA